MTPQLQAVCLGLIQGLTEFLPVSSSAHLTLMPWAFGWEDPGLAFDVALHMGTLLGVLIYFSKDLWAMFTGPERMRWFTVLVSGTIPGAIAGIIFKKQAETIFRDPGLIAGSLIAGAILLALADRRAGKHVLSEFTVFQAFLIGLAQALAVVPGISRSAITIIAALLLGYDRTSSARFSFLLSIPIIAGAGILEVPKLLRAHPDMMFLGSGFLASAIAGLLAIHLLIRILRTQTYMPFVVYRIVLGGLVIGRLLTLHA